jgi:DNA (cytosine-5)-methyltransferase 1
MSENKYTFIELCSGCGGLSTGFINKGFIPKLLNDNDKYCCETLKLNHGNDCKIICDSMVNINYDEYKNIDIIMGGVPCQSFSLAGKQKGLGDTRGNLLIEFLKIVNKIKPKIFIIENVKGLLYNNKGKTFEFIKTKIEELKIYNMYYKILNANDFEVAQKRERIFIIGVINTITKEYKFPTPNKNRLVLKDILVNIPKSEGYKYSEKKKKIMDKIPEGGCWINLPLNIQKEYMGKSFNSSGGKRGIAKRLSMDKPSLTLTTSPNQKQTERCHPLETRPLTIMEYARIQSFPDNYKFYGSIAQKYKQIGNAVPVKLAEYIAESIKQVLM